MSKKKTIEDCHKLAEEHGGKCLSTEYINARTKLEWECSEGHRWFIPYIKIQGGSWCSECAKNLRIKIQTKNKNYIEDCNKTAEKHNGKCLSIECPNKLQKLEWECSEKHRWFSSYKSVVINNSWCRKCYHAEHKPSNIKTLEDAQHLAELNSGKCLSTEYINAITDMEWECEFGHIWKASYNKIQSGHWCVYCAKNMKKTLKDMQDFAHEHNGECLSTEYINAYQKLEWQCSEGHIWQSTYGNVVKKDNWCSICAGNIKITLDDAKKLATSKGGLCISDKYIHSESPLKWQCEFGHIWESPWHNMMHGTHWCPECAGCKRHIIEDCHKLADKNNGKCLSTEYINIKTSMEWECSEGHTWFSSFGNINAGHWCPECCVWKSQKQLFDIIKELYTNNLIFKSNVKKLKWLDGQELDIYVRSTDNNFSLAVEYDGQQHFNPVRFGGISIEKAQENLKYIKERDARKNIKISQHPEDVKYFIRFKYDEPLEKEYVLNKLKENNIPII